MIYQYTHAVSPPQEEFCSRQEFVTGFCAGRAAGKSFVGALKVLLTARNGERWMAAAPTYTMLEDATFAAFEEVARNTKLLIKAKSGKPPKAVFRTQDNGTAQIVFRSADNPERLRGPSLPGLWLDEASLMHLKVFRIGIASLRYRGRMGHLTLTFTPRGRRHWTFETFYREIKHDDPDYDSANVLNLGGRLYLPRQGTALVRAHTLDNPFAPPEFYDTIRSHYTSSLAAQELAGEFVDLEGLIFRGEWFAEKFVQIAPREARRVRYWDRAATHGSGKYTAGILQAMTPDGRFFIEDCVRGQWSALERDQIMVETARRDAIKYGNEVLIVAEQEGGSAGKEISEQFIRRLSGFPVYRDIVSGKRHRVIDNVELPGDAKIVRAWPLAAQAEAGNVYIVVGDWNDEFLIELTGFPDYAFSDQVDAASGGFNWLNKFGPHDPGEVSRPEIETSAEHFGLTLIRSHRRRRGL